MVGYVVRMLTLRATTSADIRHVTSWEADADTAPWLGETGRGWHERALADPDQHHLIAEDAGAPGMGGNSHQDAAASTAP